MKLSGGDEEVDLGVVILECMKVIEWEVGKGFFVCVDWIWGIVFNCSIRYGDEVLGESVGFKCFDFLVIGVCFCIIVRVYIFIRFILRMR